MKPIISVEGLGKRYIIRHEGQTPYKSLREELFKLPGRLLGGRSQQQHEEFWALRDVSFDIMQGDRVGIIGRNGAGKSTLLKLLSRVTEPSVGRITMRGRVASLLEVGTGFHPELSGRENIFLNGAILGMRREEVRRKFDEIVDFAGVERFLDTPVKRYSSGMYVRLAFAVAANLEPEILIVDEVLAVGDAEFQDKCIGKMEEVSKGQGRTVLFVSHNIAMISRFCTKGIWFKNGECKFYGPMQGAIEQYRNDLSRNQVVFEKKIESPESIQFFSVYTSDSDGTPKATFEHFNSVCLVIKIHTPSCKNSIEASISMYDQNKIRIFTVNEPLNKYTPDGNILTLLVKFKKGFIVPGSYSWLLSLVLHGITSYDIIDDAVNFKVIDVGSEFSMYPAGCYGSVKADYTITKI